MTHFLKFGKIYISSQKNSKNSWSSILENQLFSIFNFPCHNIYFRSIFPIRHFKFKLKKCPQLIKTNPSLKLKISSHHFIKNNRREHNHHKNVPIPRPKTKTHVKLSIFQPTGWLRQTTVLEPLDPRVAPPKKSTAFEYYPFFSKHQLKLLCSHTLSHVTPYNDYEVLSLTTHYSLKTVKTKKIHKILAHLAHVWLKSQKGTTRIRRYAEKT